MTTVVVVGANRGIGLEFCKQLAERGDDVIGTSRSASSTLADLGIESIDGVDITSDEGVARLSAALGERPVDWLIVNAGQLRRTSLGEPDLDTVTALFHVNAVGPLRVVSALLGNLRKGSKVGLVTSRMGSVDDNTSGGHYAYRMSKAALNMAGKSMAVDLRDRGIAVRLLHPGAVKTDMTGGHGLIEARESVEGLIARMEDLDIESTGEFRHQNGERLPW